MLVCTLSHLGSYIQPMLYMDYLCLLFQILRPLVMLSAVLFSLFSKTMSALLFIYSFHFCMRMISSNSFPPKKWWTSEEVNFPKFSSWQLQPIFSLKCTRFWIWEIVLEMIMKPNTSISLLYFYHVFLHMISYCIYFRTWCLCVNYLTTLLSVMSTKVFDFFAWCSAVVPYTFLA